MFSKIVVVLATISAVAYGQLLQSPQALRLVPVGGVQTVGLQAAQPQLFFTGAAPAATGVQFLQQPSVRLFQQPAAAFQLVAHQQPSVQLVQAQPQAQSFSFSTETLAAQPAPLPAPAPAPAPVRIEPPRSFNIPAPAPAAEDDYYEPGTPVAPYAFSFDETDEYGMNLQRQETSENGIVTGQYSFTTPEGYTRTVRYVSDEKGFRADVETNEPGTVTSSTADAEYRSSAQPPAQQ